MADFNKIKLGIISTHPIQYQVPWFRELSRLPELEVLVYFVMLPDAEQQGVGFGQAFTWDLPLLEGYAWRQLDNRAARPSLGNFRGCRLAGFARQLKQDGIQTLIVTGWHSYALLQAAWAARWAGIPVIVRGESNALRERAWWVRGVHRALLKLYDYYLFIGNASQAFYLRNGVAEERLFPCRYFIENQRFLSSAQQLRPQREALRRDWNIAEGATCFLFCAKFIDKKRPLDLLHALARALEQNPRLHLLMVGSGELLETAKQFVEARRLPVSFAGFLNQSQIPSAYVAADCLVLPSDYGETWGLVVNEAMACGLPALVSDRVGCWPDLIHPGKTGEMFAFGDIEQLAAQLVTLAQDPQRLRQMGERAQTLVLEQYSVGGAVQGTLQALRRATTHSLPS